MIKFFSIHLSRGNTYLLGYVTVVLTSSLLRFSLAFVNREANDNHWEVINHLMVGIRSLSKSDCGECFHPKLYYLFCAAIFELFGIGTKESQLIIGQMFNALSGIVTLGAIWWLLRSFVTNHFCLYLTFSLLVLNPKFIGINGQLSNDSFAIMFSTIAIVLFYKFLKTSDRSIYIFSQLALAGSLMTKGTTWPVGIAFFFVLFFRIFASRETSISNFFLFFISIAISILSVRFADYDFKSFDSYAYKGRKRPLHLLEPTIVGRPGVTSIVDGYFTFKIGELIRHPFIGRLRQPIPKHRSSVWSQLYGRTHFAHFDNHPLSWRTTNFIVGWLGSLIMVVALPITMLFLVGLMRQMNSFLKGFRLQGLSFLVKGEEYLFLLIAIGYIAFIITFTYAYRDFAAMKVIYMFPGIIAFAVCLYDGIEFALQRYRLCSFFYYGIVAFVVGLNTCYVLDIVLLIQQLLT